VKFSRFGTRVPSAELFFPFNSRLVLCCSGTRFRVEGVDFSAAGFRAAWGPIFNSFQLGACVWGVLTSSELCWS